MHSDRRRALSIGYGLTLSVGVGSVGDAQIAVADANENFRSVAAVRTGLGEVWHENPGRRHGGVTRESGAEADIVDDRMKGVEPSEAFRGVPVEGLAGRSLGCIAGVRIRRRRDHDRWNHRGN